MNTSAPCSFCDPQVKELQEITRNATIRVVYPWSPVISEHVMLLPIRHIPSAAELSPQEAADFIEIISRFKNGFRSYSHKTGFNLLENDGPEAGQHVPHVHFHMFGRAIDELKNPLRILANLATSPVEKLSIEQMKASVIAFKKAITS